MKTVLAGILFVPIFLSALSCSPHRPTDSTACIESFQSSGERNAHSLIFDESSGKVLLFGGADSRRVCGDTWEWDGSSWKNTDKIGPSPRTFAAMAYNANTASSYLFGGNSVLFGKRSSWPFAGASTLLEDLWKRDDDIWELITPVGNSPGARAEAAMAFDPNRDRLILFGGYRLPDGKLLRLGDTWEWDGSNWELVSSIGPPPQNGASMAYDSARKRTVLFGQSADGSNGETWEWDGSSWAFIDSAVSPTRYNATLAFHDDLGQIVRFGGWNGDQRVADTWLYDGKTWTEVYGTAPPARNHSAMVYDSVEGRTILYGGHNGDFVFADMWEFSGNTWTPLIIREPLRRVDNGH